MFGLLPWQVEVIDEWFNNNFNNRLAFLKVKPEYSI